jgi:hypothetical protein
MLVSQFCQERNSNGQPRISRPDRGRRARHSRLGRANGIGTGRLAAANASELDRDHIERKLARSRWETAEGFLAESHRTRSQGNGERPAGVA